MSGPRVRPMTPVDVPEVESVVSAAFAAGDEHVAVNAVLKDLRRTGLIRTELVVEEGSGVVGYVALSTAWLDARPQVVEVSVLSPLAVLPDRQGAGVGTALVAAALAAVDRAGDPLVFLEGSPDYYAARGFRPAAQHRLVPPSVRIPEPACQVVLLSAYEEWMTGALVYPDAWWRHDLVGLRDPLLAELEQRWPRDPAPDQSSQNSATNR